MIQSLTIKGLRGIAETAVEGLAQLTIFVGPNGCGKSTFLEAAGVVCADGDASAVFRALAAREWLGLAGLAHWFNLDTGAEIRGRMVQPGAEVSESERNVITRIHQVQAPEHLVQLARSAGGTGPFGALGVQKGKDMDRVVVSEDGVDVVQEEKGTAIVPFSFHATFPNRPAGVLRRSTGPRFSSALREALARIKLSPWYDDFFRYVKVLRPRLLSIESIAVGDRDEPFLFEESPTRIGYPLAYAGDGFYRALLLTAALAEAKGGVSALDEPEAYAHPRLYGPIAQLCTKAMADRTQVLIATHSRELVEALFNAFKEQPDSIAVVGLSRENANVEATVYPGRDALRRVLEHGDDLRL